MKTLEHVGAVGVFIVHLAVTFFICFGWLWPELLPIYIALLVYVFVQNFILGYCVLTRLEFSLRRMINPKLRGKFDFTTYYTYKLTHKRLSTQFMRFAGIIFVAASLGINLYFNFLYA